MLATNCRGSLAPGRHHQVDAGHCPLDGAVDSHRPEPIPSLGRSRVDHASAPGGAGRRRGAPGQPQQQPSRHHETTMSDVDPSRCNGNEHRPSRGQCILQVHVRFRKASMPRHGRDTKQDRYRTDPVDGKKSLCAPGRAMAENFARGVGPERLPKQALRKNTELRRSIHAVHEFLLRSFLSVLNRKRGHQSEERGLIHGLAKIALAIAARQRGRGRQKLSLHEEVHPRKRLGARWAHQRFLARLARLLPDGCQPIVMTDAGFRSTWFDLVSRRRWQWIGRVRNRDMVSVAGGPWRRATHLYALANEQPQEFLDLLHVRDHPAQRRMILVKHPPKGRTSLTSLEKWARLNSYVATRTNRAWHFFYDSLRLNMNSSLETFESEPHDRKKFEERGNSYPRDPRRWMRNIQGTHVRADVQVNRNRRSSVLERGTCADTVPSTGRAAVGLPRGVEFARQGRFERF